MAIMTTQEHPPHPTAETVIDSGDEAEAVVLSRAEARRKNTKAGASAGNSEARKSSKHHKDDKKKKDRSKKWGFGSSIVGQQDKRPQAGKTRTYSSSSLTAEKPVPQQKSHKSEHQITLTTTSSTKRTASTSEDVSTKLPPTPPSETSPVVHYASIPAEAPDTPVSPVEPINHDIEIVDDADESMPVRKNNNGGRSGASRDQSRPQAPYSVISTSSEDSSRSAGSYERESSSASSPNFGVAASNTRKRFSSSSGHYGADENMLSPLPEAPAPPTRGSVPSSSDDDDSVPDDTTAQYAHYQGGNNSNAGSTSASTPKASVPPPLTRPGMPSRNGSSGYNYSAGGRYNPSSAYDYEISPSTQVYEAPTARKRSSFSSNGSRSTVVPAAITTMGAQASVGPGAAADSSVFEFLDEGDEDAIVEEKSGSNTLEEEEESMTVTEAEEPAELTLEDDLADEDNTRDNEDQSKFVEKAEEHVGSTTSPPEVLSPENKPATKSSYNSSYSSYFPSGYGDYTAGGMASSLPPNKQSLDGKSPPLTTSNIPMESITEGAMVRTPQKMSFKESLKARRDAAAAEVAELNTAHENESYDYGQQHYTEAPPPKGPFNRGRKPHQRQQSQKFQQKGISPQHQPQHPSYYDAYDPYQAYGGDPYNQYGSQQPPMHQGAAGSMHERYQPGHASHMRSMSSPNPMAGFGLPGGMYGSSTYSMMDSAASQVGSSILNGTYPPPPVTRADRRRPPPASTGFHANAGSFPSPTYGGYYHNASHNNPEGFYGDENYGYSMTEEYEYEEPTAPESPEWPGRRASSTDYKSGSNRNSMQWVTAEWADDDSRDSSRPPAGAKAIQSVGEREELELGRDGPTDQSWSSKPGSTKLRRRGTIGEKSMGSHYSDTSSRISSSMGPAPAPNTSRKKAFREKMAAQQQQQQQQQPQQHKPELPDQKQKQDEEGLDTQNIDDKVIDDDITPENLPQPPDTPPPQKHSLPTPEDTPPITDFPRMPRSRMGSRPPTSRCRSTNRQSMHLDPRSATIATVQTALGYPHLSSHLSSSPTTAVYRRFDNLNHRILLHLQDEICELEGLLESLDDMERSGNTGGAGLRTRRGTNANAESMSGAMENNAARRLELMGAIFVKLQQYNQALTTYSKLLNVLPGASAETVNNYRSWMNMHQPIVPEEMEFLFRSNDFSALAEHKQPDFNRADYPISSEPVHNIQRLGLLETMIEWIKNQDATMQLVILIIMFFILPVFLFLFTSTTYGRFLLVTLLTSGFCYFSASILFRGDSNKGPASGQPMRPHLPTKAGQNPATSSPQEASMPTQDAFGVTAPDVNATASTEHK